jgi:hypothetical protein
MWDVKPTGDYAADCETGQQYAVAFMDSCDGTNGWATLLPNIVADMIRAGPADGIVIGFMGVIGRAMCASISYACNLHGDRPSA